MEVERKEYQKQQALQGKIVSAVRCYIIEKREVKILSFC